MTGPEADSLPREVITLQLHLLDLYEALLATSAWDEAKMNAVLKTFMSSALALMRVQQAISGKVVPAQQEMIREYRARLEDWLARHAGAAEGRAPV
jgi:hypothetical protein